MGQEAIHPNHTHYPLSHPAKATMFYIVSLREIKMDFVTLASDNLKVVTPTVGK